MRWEKPLEPLPCALAETVARASDNAASSLAPAARTARAARSVAASRVKRRVMRVERESHTPGDPSRLQAKMSSRLTDFARPRAARASARTAARSFVLSIRVSLAIGSSPRVIIISSPASTLARRSGRFAVASPTLTVSVTDYGPRVDEPASDGGYPAAEIVGPERLGQDALVRVELRT
jgi:hypothetical protein